MTGTARRGDWFHPRGTLASGDWDVVVDRALTGWEFTGLRTATLHDSRVELAAAPAEHLIVPLSGSFTVRYRLAAQADPTEQVLGGRTSVFAGPTDVLYLPTGASAVIEGTGRIAVASAPTTEAHPVAYLPHSAVPVELRGAGRSSRQVHNFGTPAVLDAARLIVCEVITRAENWSSYPPHKHDEEIPGVESRLEEIYFFEAAVTRGASAPDEAVPFGFARTYSSDAGEIDELAEVRTGDVALVPFGWHGPCVAAPGYDLYYLNVMAGPGAERAWRITDDPAHAWVRDTWIGQDPDPRLPYTPEPRKDSQT